MKGNFEQCRKLTGISEGGWSDRPLKDDPGGPTMKGITLATYKAWCATHGLPVPTKQDLRSILDDTVSAIFKAQYWDAVKGDRLPLGLDYAVFDFAINSGPARATMVLQGLLGVTADGIVGAMTLAAIQAVTGDAMETANLIDQYQDARLAFLKSLKTWGANPGWPVRVEAVRRQSKEMLRGTTPEVLSVEPVAKPPASDQKATASEEGKSAVVTGIGAAGAAVSQAGTQIQPLASVSQWALYAFIALTVFGVAFTAIAIYRRKAKAA